MIAAQLLLIQTNNLNGLEVVTKQTPEIIKEASKSPLGILALIIIALSGLAFIYFRTATQAVRVLIYLVLIGAAAAYTVAVVDVPRATLKYAGHLLDEDDQQAIQNAKVSLDVDGLPIVHYTDSEGSYYFEAPSTGHLQSLRIDKEGYQHYQQQLAGNPAQIPPEIRLKKLLKQAKQTSTAVACDPVEVRSGSQPSGWAKDWSASYTLRVDKSPSGCTVDSVRFWLTGDRQCNAWAECKEVTKSDDGVEYQFRLQGHEEDPPPRYSEAHLRVEYKPK